VNVNENGGCSSGSPVCNSAVARSNEVAGSDSGGEPDPLAPVDAHADDHPDSECVRATADLDRHRYGDGDANSDATQTRPSHGHADEYADGDQHFDTDRHPVRQRAAQTATSTRTATPTRTPTSVVTPTSVLRPVHAHADPEVTLMRSA